MVYVHIICGNNLSPLDALESRARGEFDVAGKEAAGKVGKTKELIMGISWGKARG